MSFPFLNLVLLIAAVAIPVVIHLLNRRRYQVVDWGAMQFLQVSQTTRRRLLLEEMLLLLLRMGLVALFVLGLAGPEIGSSLLAGLGGRPSRDVVLLIDGSYSMGFDNGTGKTPHETAKEWAAAYLDNLKAADRVAIYQVGQQVMPLLEDLTTDLAVARQRIKQLAEPRGGADWPRALEEASKILASTGKAGTAEVLVLSDGQRFGWADAETLSRWERVAASFRSPVEAVEGAPARKPKITYVDVKAKTQDTAWANYALAPLQSSRAIAWAGQTLKFKTALVIDGLKDYERPHRLRLEVDGEHVQDLPLPAEGTLLKGQMPLSFTHRLTGPGSHLVSIILEPDLPAKQRPADYQPRDCLPGDNRQDLAVHVLASLPVLLVAGDDKLGPESSTFFLHKALNFALDPKQAPVVKAEVVVAKDLDARRLIEAGSEKPRVLILADVPRLSQSQEEAIERFLAAGGGLLVVVGQRVEAAAGYYNDRLYRGGQGWLPARLDHVSGDRKKPEQAASPDVRRFLHPALEVFRDEPTGSLGQARFPRWWKVALPAPTSAVPAAMLTSGDPLLVERTHKGGRVILCTVPLDRSWDANLPSLLEFPVLVHELVSYLADARAVEFNLQPGQPLTFSPDRPRAELDKEGPVNVVVHVPGGELKHLETQRFPLTVPTPQTGVYRVQPDNGAPVYYVVHHDPRESDLTPCTDEDRQRVAGLVPIHHVEHGQPLSDILGTPPIQELWWMFLVGVILFLCMEVWMTRRMVAAREA